MIDMKFNRFKIEDIEIGDEVFFDDVYVGSLLTQSNYDQYWTVHGKDHNLLLVNLNNREFWTIDVSLIRRHIRISNK